MLEKTFQLHDLSNFRALLPGPHESTVHCTVVKKERHPRDKKFGPVKIACPVE